MNTEFKTKSIIKRSLIALVVIILLFGSFGTVGSGERGVRTQFDKVVGVVEPGLYVKIPFIQQVHKISTQTQVVRYENDNPLTGASKDLQDVAISTVVAYHIDPAKVVDLFIQYRSLEIHEEKVLKPIVRDNVKAISANYTAEELVTKRNEYGDNTRSKLNEKLANTFVVVENSNITNIQFSKSFSEAIESKVTAVQNAEAAKNKLVQIQYEGQQKVVTAEAEAKAARLISDAANNEKYISLKALEVQEKAIAKWNGALPTQMIPGSTLPFINVTK